MYFMEKELDEEVLKEAVEFSKSMESITTRDELETCIYMVYHAIMWGKRTHK